MFWITASITAVFGLLSLRGIISVRSFDDEVRIPRLGLGTAALGGKAEWVTQYALNSGVKLIDTAQAQEWYDEKAVSLAINRFLDENREENGEDKVFVVTKIHPRSYSLEKMRQKLSETVENFRHRKIEVVLLHNSRCWPGSCTPDEEKVSWKEGWTNLEQLKDEFNIQMIGVSNFNYQELEELVLNHANRKVSVLQNWMDPFHQDSEIRRFCEKHRIQYMGYSSFGTQWYQLPENPVFTSQVLQGIANKHSTSISQVVISWLVRENVIAIPRCSNVSHLQENFGICLSKKHAICAINGDVTESDLPIKLDDSDILQIRALDGSFASPSE